jgi:hypothetical protein
MAPIFQGSRPRRASSSTCLSARGVTRSVVGPGRLELPTSRLSGVCSNQLSYRPLKRSAWTPAEIPSKDLGRPMRDRTAACRLRLRCLRKEKRRRRRPAPVLVSLDASIDRETVWRSILRKEVIQPQVPLRLPCYDFTPVADPTVVGCLHCWLAHRLRVKPTPMV